MSLSPYITFSHEEWARLRAATPLTLTEDDLATLHGINERVSLAEVTEIYLPLSRLLNLYVAASRDLSAVTDTFLGKPAARVPYIIGIAGSVAAGKSTTARILQALLACWPNHPRVDLVTTDGFLYPNAVLEARGLMHRKGFPESYDRRRLLRFLAEVQSGMSPVEAPKYSHITYDILSDDAQIVDRPDILIVEGLNVLQAGGQANSTSRRFVSDYFDFSLYVDADEIDLERWYVERFLMLRDSIFRDQHSYFRRYAHLSFTEAVEEATTIWREINGVNLRKNIRPTRERAHLILEKGPDHSVRQVWLRKR
ncbi:MAG TPA: type I pantothenate kinase [Chloroflexota bacterium]|jgi:type I pantothenate kinase